MDADMKVESLLCSFKQIIQNNPQNGKTSRTLMLKHDWSKELGAKSENQKPFYFHVQISVYREDHQSSDKPLPDVTLPLVPWSLGWR